MYYNTYNDNKEFFIKTSKGTITMKSGVININANK